MRASLCLQALLLASIAHAQIPARNHERNDYFAIELYEGVDPHHVALQLGATLEGKLGEIANHFTFSSPKTQGSIIEDTLQDLKRRRKFKRGLEGRTALDGVKWHQKQQLRKRLVKRIPPPPPGLQSRQQGPPGSTSEGSNQEQEAALKKLDQIALDLGIKDPNFKDQWHLFNPVQLGHDLNVTGVWLSGNTGNGTIAAVIDDGLELDSNEMKGNYYAPGSWDFNDPGPDPKPRLSDDHHGTRCAGEIAAVRNNLCGVGMAYDSRIAGIRILSKPITDEDEALAVNYRMQENQIYSCSWGPPDDGRTMEAPGVLIRKAMVTAIQQGRDGLGSIYVFAAGNGASADDNCNFDGYTNSIYSITVGGIDREGKHPYYSEKCSAQLVVTYSSGSQDAIHTNDILSTTGQEECYNGHGGTSAAGPLVVGAVALALSVRPDLSWRDLQYLVVNTAVPIHEQDAGEWQTTKIGRKFSHQFGYGKMDTWAFVEAAKTFKSVKPQAWYNSPWLSVVHQVPDGDVGLAASFDITAEMLKTANLERLEHVTVTMNVNHTRRGDLSVELRSPEGIVSHIATSRRHDEERSGYEDWTFMSVAHWGESGIGTWTIIVKDTEVNEHRGFFLDWRLNLWGESIDGTNQPLHPLPDEHEDDHETATVPVATTSIDPGPSKTPLPATPTDHINRPTKPKPGDETSTSISTATPTHTVSDSFLPGFFPTFGVSKRTQIWIYGSIGLIVLFCIGLGAFFLVQRRKRLRNAGRDNYEFEMINDEGEADEAKQGLTGKKGRRKRGGELYDAFAGESDEDVFSDDEDEDEDENEKYQDTPSGSGSGSGGGDNDYDRDDRK